MFIIKRTGNIEDQSSLIKEIESKSLRPFIPVAGLSFVYFPFNHSPTPFYPSDPAGCSADIRNCSFQEFELATDGVGRRARRRSASLGVARRRSAYSEEEVTGRFPAGTPTSSMARRCS